MKPLTLACRSCTCAILCKVCERWNIVFTTNSCVIATLSDLVFLCNADDSTDSWLTGQNDSLLHDNSFQGLPSEVLTTQRWISIKSHCPRRKFGIKTSVGYSSSGQVPINFQTSRMRNIHCIQDSSICVRILRSSLFPSEDESNPTT